MDADTEKYHRDITGYSTIFCYVLEFSENYGWSSFWTDFDRGTGGMGAFKVQISNAQTTVFSLYYLDDDAVPGYDAFKLSCA